ncbi:hypothetical protein [Azospirillum sp. TSO22-1]|uniref:hypothetical protein n=1 Tax=Azospirillum sp. TSO22-1 TaxID=716789 RepID=UPI000D619D4C|nr:hypothetical protein [Azospirillum sp. TSO22-1]PWC53268.1 hypothetical protein TSO221_11360 [Azospirillum sp. TSO22-1]
MQAIDRLKRVAAGEASADDLTWLSARLGSYLRNPQRGLEHALWLDCAPGEPPWWRVERQRLRDGLILRLWRERFPDLPAWEAAEQIITVQQRYAAATWKLQREQPIPPEDPTAALLWRAMKLGVRFPTSRRRIFEILKTADRDALY